MKYIPNLNMEINGHMFSYKFFEALKCVSKTWSQREAAKRLGISHTVLNRRIKEAEEKLGSRLVETTGAGSGLTEKGFEIMREYEKCLLRLEKRDKPVICGGYISTGLMEILTYEYGIDVAIYRTDDETAIELAKKGMVDILTLDDPVRAFMYDLEFIPVAYDHLVLVSSAKTPINSLDDLNGKKFIEIPGSSQRLAWNTMDNMNIDYKIVKLFKSPYSALKAVKENNELYTFLNKSFTHGSDILKKETQHLLTLVLCNKENENLNAFVDFIQVDGQKTVQKFGFERI
jgi:molybdenum-dependent DNA-binding transcriptional regulator ModE